MKAVALAVIVALGGCAFAVKHPPLAAAALGGTIGFGTCEIGTDFEEHGTCGLVGAGAAALLGLVTWGAIAIGGKGDTVLQTVETTEEDERPVPQDPTLDQPTPEAPPPPPATPPPSEPAPPATTPAPVDAPPTTSLRSRAP